MSNKTSSVEVLDTPVKSENDKKSYRVIRLENGLKALLISVPSKKDSLPKPTSNDNKQEKATVDTSEESELNSKLAACSVCVDVGSFSNPPEVQGMAHFLGVNQFFSKFRFIFQQNFHICLCIF